MDAVKDTPVDRDAAVLSLSKESATPHWTRKLQQRFLNLGLNQKIGVGIGLLVLVLAASLSLSASRQGQEYRVLFSNVSDADGAGIVAALQQMNVPYQFTEGGGAIMVPQANVYETRLKLAGQGLPKAGNVGYELLENQKFGTSQFVERVNYQRGLEGELARSVASLGQVKSARVHLAVPKQTAFVREQEHPTASVVVTLHPGRMLDPGQVAAISRLVSSSVPGMQVQDVAIMDTEGGILSPSPMRQAGLDAAQLRYTAELESVMTRRVAAILEPLAGKDGFRAQVSVEVNFDEHERTSETFGKNSPPNQQSIRSQQSVDAGGGRTATGGIPGALTNQPPKPPAAPIVNEVATATTAAAGSRPLRAPGEVETGVAVSDDNNSYRTERTVNYEVDKAIERLKSGKGQVRRISAAVLLDNKIQKSGSPASVRKVGYTSDELQQVNNLVKDAIGYVQSRGDAVSVANLPFSEEIAVETSVLTPDLVSQLVRYGAIALAVLFAYWVIVRPLMRPPQKAPEPAIQMPAEAPAAGSASPPISPAEKLRQEMAEQEQAWAVQEEMLAIKEHQLARANEREGERKLEQETNSKRRYDELVGYLGEYVEQNRQAAGLLLRAWAAEPKASPAFTPAQAPANGKAVHLEERA